ncbi:MAG: hypothetical protein HRT35_22115 [Algicola sp.]|nr:hypothetical protein [Algicola sp.]
MKITPKQSVLLLFALVMALLFVFSDESIEKNNDLEELSVALQSKINEDEKALQDQMNSFYNPVLVKPPTLACENYLVDFEFGETWQKENKARLKTLLISLMDNGLTGEELDHVAFLTKITPTDAKELIGLLNLTNTALPILSGVKSSTVPKEYSSRVFGYLYDNKMNDIIQLVEQGIIKGNTYIISEKGQQSLMGSLLMNATSVEQQSDIINQLIKLNSEITYLDLMVATQINLPLNLVRKIWLASELNASFVLPLNAGDKSLALLALENKNEQLLDFWLSQGSASVIEPFHSTLLDLLPPAINDAEKPMQTVLFKVLMQHNVSANNKNTRYKLGAWLDEDIYKQYKKQIEKKTTMSLDIANRPQVGDAVTELFFTVLQPLIKSQDSLKVEHACFKPEALRVIYSVFKSQQTSSTSITPIIKVVS